MSERRCKDCGQPHESGREALLCDMNLGGEHRVRRTLTLLGVAPSIIETTIADLNAEDS